MTDAPTIALITDFGCSDPFAGIVRGVLAASAPAARVVDISHCVPPGDIRRGALMLWEAHSFFPLRSVFLTVVDPGVGTSRRCLVCRFPRFDVVCPDNGLLTFLLDRTENWHAYELPAAPADRPEFSNTFHGRDILAPVAARIANGEQPSAIGREVDHPVRLSNPIFSGNPEIGWSGEILYADHFGNAVSSIGRITFDGQRLDPWVNTGAVGGRLRRDYNVFLSDGSALPLRRAYAEGKEVGTSFGVIGSAGLLEVAAWKTKASDSPLLQPGASIRLAPNA
jgi:S-adenosyl-L-methionine hydrolase (adenosine-forming)